MYPPAGGLATGRWAPTGELGRYDGDDGRAVDPPAGRCDATGVLGRAEDDVDRREEDGLDDREYDGLDDREERLGEE